MGAKYAIVHYSKVKPFGEWDVWRSPAVGFPFCARRWPAIYRHSPKGRFSFLFLLVLRLLWFL